LSIKKLKEEELCRMTIKHWTDEMLDKLAETVEKNADAIEKNADAIDKNADAIDKNADAINKLTGESKELNIRFSAYQQASQWVVNLAFGLLATATITTIVSAVVRK
jgi:methyl-accepting chemotaxis protein